MAYTTACTTVQAVMKIIDIDVKYIRLFIVHKIFYAVDI